MKQAKTITTNIVFVLQILLLFLLLFEGQVQLPVWLQPVGRMHPLLLHLPIGLLILLALLPLLKREIPTESLDKLQSFTLHLASLTAALTALMGFFLAQEEGYTAEALKWHKWFGVGVSFFTYSLLVWQNRASESKSIFNTAVLFNVILLIIAGHLGANITHGEDYILAPIRTKKVKTITADMPIYAAAIQPVLEEKCYNCHNESKAKGKLIMTSVEQLLTGGKHGPAWVAGNADSSEMMQRLYLPLETKEHMPPQGKPQLTDVEIQLLHAWIQSGANVRQSLKDVKKTDTLHALVNIVFNKQQKSNLQTPNYTFGFASEKKVKEFNTPFRAVYPIAMGSPALHSEIFVRASYQPQFLQELKAVQEQLVSLNVTNMPIEDADLKFIGQFQNLEKLILNGTNITGKTLNELKNCKKLHSLGLSSTAVNSDKMSVLKEFPALKNVFIWNTSISQEALAALKKEMPKIQFDGGYVPDQAEILQLSPPVLKNKTTVLAKNELVTLENKLPGVTIRYTTDGKEPDSLTSAIYKEPFQLKEYTILKIKNFKEKWKSSAVRSFTLFPKGHPTVRAELRSVAEPAIYKSKGVSVLYDNKKGDLDNVKNSPWMGFQLEPLDAYFYFGEKPPTVQEVTLSIAKNIGYRAFPPAKIEVWGGADSTKMQRLAVLSPKQPKDYEPNEVIGIRVPVPKSNFRCYRIVAYPIARIPDWYKEKKYKPRILVDEVFFY